MTTMNWRRAFPFVVIALLLVGCVGQKTGIKQGEPKKAYADVVSLSPSTTEILHSGGGIKYLVGRTENCDNPPTIGGVRVVANIKPDYEAIVEIQPDLIIYDTMLYSEDDIAKIEQLGFETLAYNADTIVEFVDFGYRLAAKLSIETQMSAHIDKIYHQVSAAKAVDTGDPRTTIMLGAEGSGDYLVMGDSGIHSALIDTAGGSVVGVEGRMFQQMSIEKLIDADPEIIFTDGVAMQILEDPRLQGISAVKNQHVYDVNASKLVRIGNSMGDLILAMNEFITKKPTPNLVEAS